MITEKIKKLETKHKLISFISIIFVTIIITRASLGIKDVDLIIKGFELHHFYYGITLLILTIILLLFTKKHYAIYLTLAAISIGLILDEFLYVSNGFGNYEIYVSTFPSATILAIIISIITIFIFRISKLPFNAIGKNFKVKI